MHAYTHLHTHTHTLPHTHPDTHSHTQNVIKAVSTLCDQNSFVIRIYYWFVVLQFWTTCSSWLVVAFIWTPRKSSCLSSSKRCGQQTLEQMRCWKYWLVVWFQSVPTSAPAHCCPVDWSCGELQDKLQLHARATVLLLLEHIVDSAGVERFLSDLQVPLHSMNITFHVLTVQNLQVLLWFIVIADLTFVPKIIYL